MIELLMSVVSMVLILYFGIAMYRIELISRHTTKAIAITSANARALIAAHENDWMAPYRVYECDNKRIGFCANYSLFRWTYNDFFPSVRLADDGELHLAVTTH